MRGWGSGRERGRGGTRTRPAPRSADLDPGTNPAYVRPAMPRARRHADATTLRLKPADPFELIRWLARSQPDPRKAIAELVQNSLDAGARRVSIRRQRVRGSLCIVVHDTGEGVLPDLERPAALEYLATHVGHSRKMGLDPAERMKRVVAGKYGVGLLGFWAVGRFLELRTRVAGSPPFALRLEEDSPRAEIFPLPQHVDAPATYTDVAVIDVHPAAQKALGGRRLADYLAAELRGQLLQRDVQLVVHDDVARGLAQKTFQVVPRRFAGERLDVPPEVEVPGHLPIRVELYLARGADRPAIQVACAGTLVADDVAQLEALGLARNPWVGRELAGILDFAGFHVPPGARRGVMPDAAAGAFAEAMDGLSPLVERELERLAQERHAALDRDVVRELRRALRGFTRRLPHYEMPRVAAREGEATPADAGAGVSEADSEPQTPLEDLALFPVGPLSIVRIVPTAVRVAPGGQRRVRAVATDADGRAVDGTSFAWSATDGHAVGLAVRGEGARCAVSVRSDAPLGVSGVLRVQARVADRTAVAEANVEVAENEADEARMGIPEPHLVSDAEGAWRSRMAGERWEVNDAHEDYGALRGDPRARLRYLLALLAKEIVMRSSGRNDAADVLESLVEVLAHAERNLRGG
jgi:hypothetical protein